MAARRTRNPGPIGPRLVKMALGSKPAEDWTRARQIISRRRPHASRPSRRNGFCRKLARTGEELWTALLLYRW
jgi:hypothetical protein